MAPTPDDHHARALAAERDHVRRYRRVQQITRVAFALAAVAAVALAWWLAQRLDSAPPAATPTTQTIEFSNTPLADVLAQFNRQNRLQLTLADPALGTLPISGAVNPSDPAAFTRLLAAAHGLRAEPRGENELVLRRQARSARTRESTSQAFFTDYANQEPRFKGLHLGADTMKIPANPAKASADSNVDAFTIVYAPGYRVANANDGYQRSVSAIYQIRLNLNIDNLLADTKLRFMSTNLRPR